MEPRQIGWSQESILLHRVGKELEKLAGILAAGGAGGGIQTITSPPGSSIVIDATDPANIIISSTAVAGITGGRNIQVTYPVDPLHPVISTTADDIVVVPTYADLPDVALNNGNFYWVSTATGTKWIPAILGGADFHNSGLYYSNGVVWQYLEVPYQATQVEVDAGTETAKFVSPATLSGYARWALKTEWKGDWISQQYLINQQVLDSGYLAIANKTTSQRPAPQKTGSPFNIYGGTIGTTTATNVKQVIFGNRYQFTTDVFFQGWRVNIIAGNNYTVYLVKDPLGQSIISQIIQVTAQRSGWINLATERLIIKAGTTYSAVAVVAQPTTVPVTVSYNYVYTEPNAAPTSLANGQSIHPKNFPGTIYFSDFDISNTSRFPQLNTLALGDTITVGNTNWAIQSVTHVGVGGAAGSYFLFGISPALLHSPVGGAAQTFAFETKNISTITYPLDNNYWGLNPSPVANVQGLLSINDTYFNAVYSGTAYGIDLLVQNLTTSPDWDIQAYSAVDSNGEGGIISNNIYAQADTGVLSFASPGLTPGTPATTTINIGAVTGYIVNNETNPGNSTYTVINYPGGTNIPVTTLGGGPSSYVMLGAGNVISFQNNFPTSAERKAKIWLGKIGHPSGAITTVINEPDYILSPQGLVRDLFQVLGPYINDGIFASPNGASLNFITSPGSLLGDGINFVNSRTNPNKISYAGANPTFFVYRTRNGQGSAATINAVDGSIWDDGVTPFPATLPGGPNVSTLQYIWAVPTNAGIGFVIQLGQVSYLSLDAAKAAVGKETNNTIFPNLIGNAILIGVLAIRKGAGNLNILSDAQLFRADKIGQISPAGGGGGVLAGPTTIILTVTTNTTITMLTTDTSGYGQDGRNVVINNGANLVTINAAPGVTASYAKAGTGNITFAVGTQNGITAVDGTFVLSGVAGSTAAVWPNGSETFVRISNA